MYKKLISVSLILMLLISVFQPVNVLAVNLIRSIELKEAPSAPLPTTAIPTTAPTETVTTPVTKPVTEPTTAYKDDDESSYDSDAEDPDYSDGSETDEYYDDVEDYEDYDDEDYDDDDDYYDDDDDFDDYDDYVKTKKVKINHKKIKMTKGKNRTLKGTVTPWDSDQDYSWKSSSKKVATVDYYGEVHAKNLGKTTITFKSGSKKATCKVTVNKMNYEIGKGKSKSLKKFLKYIKGYKKAKYSSSKKSIVSVTKKGKIKAKKHGSATITAKIKGTKYKIKVYSYSKDTLKSKAKAALKKNLYVPSSLIIKKITFPSYNKCKISYSAKNRFGVRLQTETFNAYFKNGKLKWYVK